jgi:nitronate monooxygenase
MATPFGVALPIVQAPMAGAQDAALAIAVANAGGVGFVPAAMLTPDALRAEIERVRAQTSAPFGVNFFCHEDVPPDAGALRAWSETLAPYYAELGVAAPAQTSANARRPFDEAACDVVVATKPAIVSFHFGLPSASLLARVRATGAQIAASATTVAEGEWLARAGVDVVIAQGSEAGGHRGTFLAARDLADPSRQLATLALVRALRAAIPAVPIVAAGGIGDAAAVRAALAAGACAAQIGTAYLRSNEATTSAVHRAALTESRVTAVTNVFTGRPARGVMNRLMREVGPMNARAPAFPHAATLVAPLRAAAEANGSGDFSPLWAGAGASPVRADSAARITRALAP